MLSQSGHQEPLQEWTSLGRLLPHSLVQSTRIGAWMLLALPASRARRYLDNQSCVCVFAWGGGGGGREMRECVCVCVCI